MIWRLYPARLSGTVTVPESKSAWHRALICRHLAGQALPESLSGDDVGRTLAGLRALADRAPVVDCGASGATLRFLLPLGMALERVGTVFTGVPRLLQRPLSAPYPVERTAEGWRIVSPLTAGRFFLQGDETSQTISGLMMALPLLDAPSELILTTPLVSRAYVDMTVDTLRRHGVAIEETVEGWRIPAPQRFCPAKYAIEGDWSAGSWWLTMEALQRCGITVRGLRTEDHQSDCAITDYIVHLPETVDISCTPDLLPTLALLASQRQQTVRFVGGGYLRHKESDRLHTVAATLAALGVKVAELPDGLRVEGGTPLHGGVTLDACGDHRIAMLCACAALLCDEPVILRGGECVSKSYENFWRDYIALGGKVEEIQ